MTTYTYSEARQKFAEVLDRARREGQVRIRRRDGQVFILVPEKDEGSPLDVEGIDLDLTADEIIEAVREGRER
ncbi:MAG: type II toxin-antitoxin system Phd/YefM family antitoxin [Bacteroidetes bacterium]|nr:type II toxin-antitoxin system Phd/YefM family antitoxin [Bacteroidota bacterium]